MRDEYTRTIEPARARAAETLTLERTPSDLVNQAYGLPCNPASPYRIQLQSSIWSRSSSACAVKKTSKCQGKKGLI